MSAAASSFVYIGWLLIGAVFMMYKFPGGRPDHWDLGTIAGILGVLLFFLLFAGFGATLLIMILPWIIAVWIHRRFPWPGRIYFPAAGALLVFVIGCAASAVAPKPLFIEDQTFWEGALISATREGLPLLTSGLVFGASFWSLRERLLS